MAIINDEVEIWLIKTPPSSVLPPRKRVGTKQYQSKLQTFIEGTHQVETPEISSQIKISKFFPMKFGLRKKLQTDIISYDIEDSDLHIVIHNKVLIQIYNPHNFNSKE